MANEAVPVEGPYEIHDWTVAATTAIDKYTLCMISGSRTAAASAGAAPQFAGIAMADKSVSNSDVSTELGLTKTGTFDLTAAVGLAAPIAMGDLVVTSGSNTIRQAAAVNILSGSIVGKAQENIAAGAAGEVKLGVI